MKLSASFVAFLVSFVSILLLSFAVDPPNSDNHRFADDIAIDCGSIDGGTAHDGREWIGEMGSSELALGAQLLGKSTSSIATDSDSQRLLPLDPIPYMTARVSFSEFHYTFQMSPGQKFIRLHFNSASCSGLHKSTDLFTVKGGPFTLLNAFSASLAANSSGKRVIVKEFCVNVEPNQLFNISFHPLKTSKSGRTFAFINGIEIVSMPTGLYYSVGDLGIAVVGQKYRFHIDNSTALEMVLRLNIGGRLIPPVEDSGLFRTWSEDKVYITGTGLLPMNYATKHIRYSKKPMLIAPPAIYQTFWSTDLKKLKNKLASFSWKASVDAGFAYLIRLHFCELEVSMSKSHRRRLSISINGEIVETLADIVEWSGGKGIPVHKDFVVIIKEETMVASSDIIISLESKDDSNCVFLNGMEVFKLSTHHNSLSYPGPVNLDQSSVRRSLKLKKVALAFLSAISATEALTIMLILLDIIIYWVRKTWEANLGNLEGMPSPSSKNFCHLFSLHEIHTATENFSESFVIGRGGFGKVYKGSINNGAELVAIKRLSASSKQGEHEFWMEIETLSQLRHTHLVSLLGYCCEGQEMILVYEYMPNGTLSRLLHGAGGNINNGSPVSWEQRLNICIGAARGLDYLHTGYQHGLIHRDVKSSNILLDKNLMAKISDFGLAKREKESNLQSHVSTNVKGTYGYLDPQYIHTRKLTRKTDVYAFGVVLLEVLCGRRAVDTRLPEDQWSLVSWALGYIREGKGDQIVAECMKGKISSHSLMQFLNLVKKCLHEQPKERPTMDQVVVNLTNALELQTANSSTRPEEISNNANVISLRSDRRPADGAPSVLSPAPPLREVPIMKPEKIPNNANVISLISDRRAAEGRAPSVLTPKPPLRGHPIVKPSNLKEFGFQELKSATRNFGPDYLMGGGKIGHLYKGWVQEDTLKAAKPGTGMLIAVREIESYPFRGQHEWIEIIRRLGSLNHFNLVRLIGFCMDGDHKLLVHEFMARGSLETHLFRRGDGGQPLSWIVRMKVALDAAKGLAYLHGLECPIIHQKLTCSNILLDSNYNAKLSDYELVLDDSREHSYDTTTRIAGVPNTGPPEYVYTGRLTAKGNVYSFGEVLLELLCGRRLLDISLPKGERYLVEWVRPNISSQRIGRIMDARIEGDQYTKQGALKLAKLAYLCLAQNSIARPDMSEVVKTLEHF